MGKASEQLNQARISLSFPEFLLTHPCASLDMELVPQDESNPASALRVLGIRDK